MKIILFTLLLLSQSGSALAGGFTKQQIASYKAQCESDYSHSLSKNATNDFCNCVTTHVARNFTPNEVARSSSSTIIASKIKNKAQLPCMGIPLRNIVFNKCLKDEKISIYSSQKENVCICVAKNTTEFASSRISKIIAQNNGNQGLVSIILEDQSIQRNLTSNISVCAQSAGY